MTISYQPKGVCSRQISFEIDGNIVRNVKFLQGCAGNTQGVSRLVEGLTVEDVIKKLSGIRCGGKPTSCPDQLAQAVKQAIEQEQQ